MGDPVGEVVEADPANDGMFELVDKAVGAPVVTVLRGGPCSASSPDEVGAKLDGAGDARVAGVATAVGAVVRIDLGVGLVASVGGGVVGVATVGVVGDWAGATVVTSPSLGAAGVSTSRGADGAGVASAAVPDDPAGFSHTYCLFT